MLRGINVGGQKRVSMQALKEMYSSLGYKEVQTYVQSGNVIFSANASGSSVKEEIEREIKRAFGFDVLVFLRNRSELAALVKNSPFKQKDETKLHVTFLSEKPGKIPVDDLKLSQKRCGRLYDLRAGDLPVLP